MTTQEMLAEIGRLHMELEAAKKQLAGQQPAYQWPPSVLPSIVPYTIPATPAIPVTNPMPWQPTHGSAQSEFGGQSARN